MTSKPILQMRKRKFKKQSDFPRAPRLAELESTAKLRAQTLPLQHAAGHLTLQNLNFLNCKVEVIKSAYP